MQPDQITAFITTSRFRPGLVRDYFALRYELFFKKLGWDLKVENGLETDEFDQEETQYCLLCVKDELIAGVRLIRCDQPYLSQKIFPQLATTFSYPRNAASWDMSRYAVFPCRGDSRSHMALLSLLFDFARRRAATSLVGVIDLKFERRLSMMGLRTVRYGPPQIIGMDRFGEPIRAVAGHSRVFDQPILSRLRTIAQSMEIHDDTLLVGPKLLSA